MVPTKEDFLSAACRWQGEHQGIGYELSWHGLSDYNQQGTWCWYILLSSEQFYHDDWVKLRLEKEDKQYFAGGSWHRHWRYDDFPDVEAHGGWTFGEMHIALGRDGKEHEHVKVGCDYAHAWDHDGGFWQGKPEIERDAKHSIDLLCAMFPRRRPRCAYSGIFDDADQFYTARNGRLIHKSQEEKLKETEGWRDWLPAEAA